MSKLIKYCFVTFMLFTLMGCDKLHHSQNNYSSDKVETSELDDCDENVSTNSHSALQSIVVQGCKIY